MKPLPQLPLPPKPFGPVSQLEALAYRLRCALVLERNELAALVETRLGAIESQLAELEPVLSFNKDRARLLKTCEELDLSPQIFLKREPTRERAAQVQRVFCELRAKGWPVDRIAAASRYSGRGVALSLARAREGVEIPPPPASNSIENASRISP